MKVLIVPDKFKGTLTAPAAAAAIAAGWRRPRGRDTLELLPMSDGGDGFGEVLGELLGARAEVTVTVDATHEPRRARWWWEPKSRTAVIESAEVVGLAQLRGRKYDPLEVDTFGLGVVLQSAARAGAERCLVGVGGSATNEGSFGLARSLGWKFLDRQRQPIRRWTRLTNLERLEPPEHRLRFGELVVAVDVQNPLLGPRGCTRIYGPQKGLREVDYYPVEKCLARLAAVVKKSLKRDLGRVAGSGAAGGLGFGLCAFLGARLEPGFALFARYAGLEERLRGADLVITAEGSIDRSTVMGKGVGEVARLCGQAHVPCLGLAGRLDLDPRRDSAAVALARQRFTRLEGIAPALATIEEAKAQPGRWLTDLAARMAAEWAGRQRH
ncbi:MAG: glycerate kinase [Verrucomicrobia bacterium]|nr:glycerate kinase [Verrucomicrobiota bacterium]